MILNIEHAHQVACTERDVYKSALQRICELDTHDINSGVLAKIIAEVSLGMMVDAGRLIDSIEVRSA